MNKTSLGARYFFIVASLMLVASNVFAQTQHTLPVQRTYRELRRYIPPDDPSSETVDAPARIRLLQTRFKHELRDLITQVLNQELESLSKPPSDIRQAILNTFKELRIVTRSKEHLPLFSFGHVLHVCVSRPPEHADFLVVAVVIDASWDEDQSLYIFQHQSGGWVDILAAEVNGYSQIYYAQSSRFNYAVSPAAPDGSWFLVTSSVNPHMASAWQHVTYTALTPGRDADHPKVLMRHTHVIYLAGSSDESHACHIKITATSFRVSFSMGWEPGGADERFIDEYRVANGKAKRLAARCLTRKIMGRSAPCDPQDKM